MFVGVRLFDVVGDQSSNTSQVSAVSFVESNESQRAPVDFISWRVRVLIIVNRPRDPRAAL